MTAEKYLKQYEWAVNRIRRLEEEYEAESVLIDAVRSVSDNDGMPHGSGISKPTEDKAVRLADKAMRLVDARLEAVRIRQEVFDTVMRLDGLERDVLVERFINLKTWEEVCDAVHYSWTSVRLAWHRGEELIQSIIEQE
jgi:hypothetical protein